MVLHEQHGDGIHARFTVSFHERKLTDILAIDENDRSDERDFAAVQRFSELGTELYDIWARPLVQSVVTPQTRGDPQEDPSRPRSRARCSATRTR